MAAVSRRMALAEDAGAIAWLHRAARAAAMPWLAVVHSPEEDLAYFRENVLPSADVKVAEADGVLAGFIARRDAWIDHLYIAPAFWRKGIGRQLLGPEMASAIRLELWTFQRNEGARRFYESHGFRAAEFTDGARNEECEPDMRYVWTR
jgi:GNAT superfamily N-acetyltransferase